MGSNPDVDDYDVSNSGGSLGAERLFILGMVESGRIRAEEGLRLIQALTTGEAPPFLPASGEALAGEAGAEDPGDPPAGFNSPWETGMAEPPPVEAAAPAAEGPAPQAGAETVLEPDWAGVPRRSPSPLEAEKWRRWWRLPLAFGVGVTVLGALFLFWVQQQAGVNFWFFCASLPFSLGVALIALAWGSRTARWLHLRIDRQPGERPQRIAISFPLPLQLTAWFLRTFRRWIPGMEAAPADELLTALEDSASADDPLYIDVENNDNGEHVRVFIG